MSKPKGSPRQRPQRRTASTIASARLTQQFNSTPHHSSHHQQQTAAENNNQTEQHQQQPRRSARLTTETTASSPDVQFPESNIRGTTQQPTRTAVAAGAPVQPIIQGRKRPRSSITVPSSSSSVTNNDKRTEGNKDDSETLISSEAQRVTKQARRSVATESESSSSRHTQRNIRPTEYNLSPDVPLETSHQVLHDRVPSHLYQVARSNPAMRASVQSMTIWQDICRVQNIEIPDRTQQTETVQDSMVDYYSFAVSHIRSTCDQCFSRLTKKSPLSIQVSRDGPLQRLCPDCLATIQDQQQQQMVDRRLSLIARLELLEKQGFNIDHEQSRIFNDYINTIYPKEQSEDMIIEQLIRESRFNRRWEQGRQLQSESATSNTGTELTRQDKVTRTNYIKSRGPLRNDFETVIRKVLEDEQIGPYFTTQQREDAMNWLERQVLRYRDEISQDFPSAGQEVSNTLALCYYAQSRLCHRCFGDDIENDVNQDIKDPASEYFWDEIRSMKQDIAKAYTKKCVNEGFHIMRDDEEFCNQIIEGGCHNPNVSDIRQAMDRGARHFELLEMERNGGELTMGVHRGALNTHLQEILRQDYHDFVINQICSQFRRENGYFVHV